jgi:two-component system phosphate regulon sensor histidine kinase PhoR
MNLRVLVLVTATGVAITLSAVNFYFQHKWYDVMITFTATLAVSYFVFYYLIEKYIYSRIKLIYKLIHNLKLGRDLRDALGEHITANPIDDVEQE